FSTEVVGAAHHTRFGHGGMGEKRGLHFDGADAVPGNVKDFVGAAGEPDVAVIVDVCGISAVINVANDLPVIAAIAFGFSPQLWRQAREGTPNHHDAFLIRAAGRAVHLHHSGVNARHGNR